METEPHLVIARRHLESFGTNTICRDLLNSDVRLTFMDTRETFEGPEEVCAFFDNLHGNLFHAVSTARSLHTSTSRIAVEAEFRGTHVREFAGLQASGKQVSWDYVLAYDFDDERISAIRAYWNLDSLVRQVRGG